MQKLTLPMLGLLYYFDQGILPVGLGTSHKTYAALESRGLLRSSEAWPFHVPTDAGREALHYAMRNPVFRYMVRNSGVWQVSAKLDLVDALALLVRLRVKKVPKDVWSILPL